MNWIDTKDFPIVKMKKGRESVVVVVERGIAGVGRGMADKET